MNNMSFRPGNAEISNCGTERIWLLGQPHLQDYLDFVREKVIGGQTADPRALVDEWRRANDYYYELEEREAGIADQVECRPLDDRVQPLADEVAADFRFRNTFDSLPTRFGMVELDRLVVYQTHVTRQFVDGLAQQLGASPDAQRLFRFCLPLDREEAPVQVQRVGANRYMFSSDSTDLRSHEPVLLQAAQISHYATFGPVDAVVGLVVGFGSNFLNVVQADKRLILKNGYHRACAMRALGITHAPCIIQTVTRRDELNIAASKAVAEAPEFYCNAPRPPLLKDFFDSAVRKMLPVRRVRKLIEVKFKMREFHVAE